MGVEIKGDGWNVVSSRLADPQCGIPAWSRIGGATCGAGSLSVRHVGGETSRQNSGHEGGQTGSEGAGGEGHQGDMGRQEGLQVERAGGRGVGKTYGAGEVLVPALQVGL